MHQSTTFRSIYGSTAILDTGAIDIPHTLQFNGGDAKPNGKLLWHRPQCPELPPDEAKDARQRLLTPEEREEMAKAARPVLANEPTFKDNADELIRVGRLITSFRRIGLAIRDRRCERAHLIVLYAIMELINHGTGTAFPSRRAIAEQEGLNERAVENAVYELRSWGYIDWERRAEPDLHKGRLLHYTLPVLTWTEEDLTRAILAHRETLKARSAPPTVYTAHGAHRQRSTPPTVSGSTPPAVTRNLLKEPANTLPGADAPDVRATDLFAKGAPGQGEAPSDRAPPSAKRGHCKPKGVSDAEIDAGFLEWYAAYPRKEAPKDAKRAYARILKSGEATIPQLLAAAKAYKFSAAPLKGEKDFRPHPATWLNGGRWQTMSAEPAGTAVQDPEAELQRHLSGPEGQRAIRLHGLGEATRRFREAFLGNTKKDRG